MIFNNLRMTMLLLYFVCYQQLDYWSSYLKLLLSFYSCDGVELILNRFENILSH